jgi:hypothetical protein
MCMYGPPGVGHHPAQATPLPRSDCSSDRAVTGPPLVTWLAAPVPRAEPEREVTVEGAAEPRPRVHI